MLSINFIAKKKELAIIDDVRVRVCAEASLKVFFLRLNIGVLEHDCGQVERRCEHKNGTRARPEKFCDWHRKYFSSPGTACTCSCNLNGLKLRVGNFQIIGYFLSGGGRDRLQLTVFTVSYDPPLFRSIVTGRVYVQLRRVSKNALPKSV